MKTVRVALTSLLIVVAFSAVTPSYASTAEEMLSACRLITTAKISNGNINLPQDFDSGVCWGAFETLDYMLMTVNFATQKPMFGVCLPENRTRPQLIAIFVKYAENHPARYSDDFIPVAFAAAKDAFSCPASKP